MRGGGIREFNSQLASLLAGLDVLELSPITGGDICEAWRVETPQCSPRHMPTQSRTQAAAIIDAYA